MKILLDTNVIIDDALEREPFLAASEQVLVMVEERTIEGYISASIVSNLYYIIRRSRNREWAASYLKQLVTFCRIATVDSHTINMALNVNFKDFEDAIQYSTAVINRLDAIITRNSGDFPVASPRILTPEQLIQELTNTP
ncbi:type II toxin-antitoxin system VapC family toxin [Halotia branconii]|uniref:PIN domain-containing protein n=1 Tax=Halotia branconii CENA392 TaxID=1539056 RepID=A0AAJ6NXU1_9CYAN|nr:PIN domain-containing protein [Halotia branconii]WGV28565.1 PIN domain-containing protein [Halotia branconii CENA392]